MTSSASRWFSTTTGLMVTISSVRPTFSPLVENSWPSQGMSINSGIPDFDSVRVSDLAPHGDDFHRVDPEERWADALATKWTGERLDRDWWRGRVLEAT